MNDAVAQPQSVQDILRKAEAFLSAKDVEAPGLVSALLMSRLLGCRHLELPLRSADILSEKKVEAMRRGIVRVAAGEPVQYVLGQTEFMGHVFKVDKRALIPRPETEVLVETVLACESLWTVTHPAVVDVGTGSGCIAISVQLARKQARIIGLDISATALELARENAAALGVDGSIPFSDMELSDTVDPETIDAIVANLPYVTTGEWQALPRHIREHEPRTALDGGPDGLAVIGPVVQDAAFALKPGGHLFLEIGATQAEAVTSLATQVGFSDVRTRQDLAGLDRIVTAVLAG